MEAPAPRFARWLLRAAAPADQRHWIVADLDEEVAMRARLHGRAAARRWYRRQVCLSCAPLVARRLDGFAGGIWRVQMRAVRGLMSDVQLAWRRLLSSPGFATVCILTLALGIGGNTAVFTLIDRVMLKPLPVPRPHELYRLGGGDDCCVNSGLAGEFSLFSYDLYLHLREAVPEIPQLAAFQANVRTVAFGRPDAGAPADTLRSAFVSGNYFDTLGVTPAAGRLLRRDDDRPGAAPVAVLSYRVWRDRYQGSASVAGLPISINGVAATIVGVAPERFYGETLRPNPAELWIPLSNEPLVQPQARLLAARASHWLYVIGRVPPAVRPETLSTRMTAALQQWITANMELRAEDQQRIAEQRTAFVPAPAGVRNMRDAVAPSLELLQAIAAAVLLIACGNLANLLMTRGFARRTETAVRVALGAPRLRVVRQYLVESMLLAVLGGLLGLAVAYAGAHAIVDLAFRGMSHVPVDASPSPSVLAFAIAVSVVTGLVFGAAPAVMASRSNPIDAMRGAGRASAHKGSKVRQSLVALQVALSLTVLTSAALLGQSLARLQAQDFGFAIDQRYVVDVLPALGGTHVSELDALYTRVRERLQEMPGVAGAAMSLYSPMSGDNWASGITVEGHDAGARLSASWNRVTADYFTTVGTPVLRGRPITDADRPGTPLVTVINQTFARRFFGDQDPIGRRIGFASARGGGVRAFEIVGIVGDAKYQDAKVAAYPTFFLPFLQTQASAPDGGPPRLDRSHLPQAIELHVERPVDSLEVHVRRVLADVDRRFAVVDVRSMADQVAGHFNVDRLIARVAVAFGGVALLLACLGLYGVTAFSVTRRTREIGIRMAVGASPGSVLRTVLRGAMLQLVFGVAIGIPAALVAGRLLQSMLYGVSGHDPLAVAAAFALLALCAVAAVLLPARRAATLDPVQALRID